MPAATQILNAQLELSTRQALSAAAHTEYLLRNTPARDWPFAHTLIRPIIPSAYYRQMIDAFPSDECFLPLNEYHPDRGAVFLTPDREGGTHDLGLLNETQRRFWAGFIEGFSSEPFRSALLGCLGGQELVRSHLENTRPMIHLSLDRKGYQIRPHTDVAQKIITALFYLPDPDDETLAAYGTSVLAQRGDTSHLDPHDWDRYNTVFTAPFVPNSMFAFRVGSDSWHGVHRVDRPIRRRSIQYFLILDQ